MAEAIRVGIIGGVWPGRAHARGYLASGGFRLMAVADVFDALMARRPYKEPMTSAQAAEFIVRGRGAHFDPAVVDAFLRVLPGCEEVARSLADEAPPILRAA